jgi:hypothetical protein
MLSKAAQQGMAAGLFGGQTAPPSVVPQAKKQQTPQPASKPAPVNPSPDYTSYPRPPVKANTGAPSTSSAVSAPEQPKGKGAFMAHLVAHGAPYHNAKRQLMEMQGQESKTASLSKEAASALGMWIAKMMRRWKVGPDLKQWAWKGVKHSGGPTGGVPSLGAKAKGIVKDRYGTIAGAAVGAPVALAMGYKGMHDPRQVPQDPEYPEYPQQQQFRP